VKSPVVVGQSQSENQPFPDWATHISGLRHGLHLSQADFGAKLRCSSMTVSRWERGLHAPSTNHYIHLGNLAGKTDCWFYWRRAGLSISDLRLLPDAPALRVCSSSTPQVIDVVIAGSGAKIPTKLLVAVPLLKVHAGTHGEVGDDLEELDEAAADEIIAAPATWCPNPAYTKCLRVKGNSMTPLIHDGHIVAVDSSQTAISKLDGKVVIAWNEQKGLTISRFRHYGDVSVLEPENREYKPVIFDPTKDGWRIAAKVLWWIGRAP
jgi:SOS-response transcriptional repressor LexA